MYTEKKLDTNQRQLFLNCRRLPARISSAEAAAVLGFSEHEIPLLVSAGLLKTLGRPAKNGPKYFSSSEILAVSGDRNWLSKATATVTKYWHGKNLRKSSEASN